MIYDSTYSLSVKQSRIYLEKIISEGGYYEIKRFKPKRTIQQNKYLHKLFQIFGNHFGYNVEEAKETVKKVLGYVYYKELRGKKLMFTKKTSEMNVVELGEFIDKFKILSEQYGCPLPSPEEYLQHQIQFEND